MVSLLVSHAQLHSKNTILNFDVVLNVSVLMSVGLGLNFECVWSHFHLHTELSQQVCLPHVRVKEKGIGV